jgi:hypothetical protein
MVGWREKQIIANREHDERTMDRTVSALASHLRLRVRAPIRRGTVTVTEPID